MDTTESTNESPMQKISLEQWVERQGRGALVRLATDTGIDYQQLRRYVKRLAIPQFKAASIISAATGGKVSVISMLSRTRAPKVVTARMRRARARRKKVA